MSVVVNEIRRGVYLDSVALMRCSRDIAAMPKIKEAALMMATLANRRVLADAGILGDDGEKAGPFDLLIAIEAEDEASAKAALAAAAQFLDRPASAGQTTAGHSPRTLRGAVRLMPEASLALISVPGDYAAAEARKALHLGLNVMIFSDNVALEDEIELKRLAQAKGRLVMGPDCGTAIIAGVPLGFANRVSRGDIGLIGASGTGLQEVSCLISRGGGGISHAIGVGGRDLKDEIGGISTLTAMALLEADEATRHVVLISKPPGPEVAARLMKAVGSSSKTYTVCILGAPEADVPANARLAPTLRDAARLATGQDPGPMPGFDPAHGSRAGGGRIFGLFAGGTLCAEAQLILVQGGHLVASNVPVPGAQRLEDATPGHHRLVDLGDDAYTRGRPHPMIDPLVRTQPLLEALDDPATAVVLLDLVLGQGAHDDPAGELAALLGRSGKKSPPVVASVVGTADDPQGLFAQIRALEAAGVRVAPSNADAAIMSLQLVSPEG